MLDRIESPQDLKGLSYKELDGLAQEIRELITEQIGRTGGHLASNLGAVELTLALHRVFRTPHDKIVWDVGHQCYTHKIVTGRREAFSTIRQKDGISGFPRVSESPHDAFDAGHASTSIAAALGYCWAMDLQNKKDSVIAVIGDGSLTGGEALESLNFCGHFPNNLIILLNDNDMSISPNVGALSSYLTRISSTGSYVAFRRFWRRFLMGIPLIGKWLYGLSNRFKGSLKGAVIKNRLFSDLGLRYIGPLDGHNIHQMEKVLQNLRDNPYGPVVVHVKTQKGRGHAPSEENPQNFHGVSPAVKPTPGESMTSIFGSWIVDRGKVDPSILAITAAMEQGTGLEAFHREFPQRFLDVGITEPMAVTMSGSLALSGMKPVIAIYSTFMQRAVDQVIHDVAINNLPVLFVMDRAGLVPQDGETHQGIFDMALFRSVPKAEILAPVSRRDAELCLDYGLQADHPVFVRLAKDKSIEDEGDQAELIPGRGYFCGGEPQEKAPVLIISLGALQEQARGAAKILEKRGVPCHVYQLRWAWPLDWEFFIDLIKAYDVVLFLEEGIENGGVGEALGHHLNGANVTVSYHHRGVPNRFPGAASRKELMEMMDLGKKSLADLLNEKWDEIRFEKVVDQVRQDKWKPRKI